MFDRQKFYEVVRPHLTLTTANVYGFERLLDEAEKRLRAPDTKFSVEDIAYILATTWWETNKQMVPVREAYWLSENWRKKNLRYYPYYGRGLIQTTWKENYLKVGELLGVGDLFVREPDQLLEWEYTVPALFEAMEKGLYTGVALEDAIDDVDESDEEDLREYKAARRIVNGTDKATEIAQLGILCERALRTALIVDDTELELLRDLRMSVKKFIKDLHDEHEEVLAG